MVHKKQHPTENSIKLMEILIENSSNEVDVVMDPFMGSGSTAKAADNLKRKFIGSEIDETYFNITLNRFNKKDNQLAIF
jgi:DNA modification methylase